MPRYRKKIPTVDAYQPAYSDTPDWAVAAMQAGSIVAALADQAPEADPPTVTLITADGDKIIERGDWIVRHPSGRLEALSEKDFSREYEAAQVGLHELPTASFWAMANSRYDSRLGDLIAAFGVLTHANPNSVVVEFELGASIALDPEERGVIGIRRKLWGEE